MDSNQLGVCLFSMRYLWDSEEITRYYYEFIKQGAHPYAAVILASVYTPEKWRTTGHKMWQGRHIYRSKLRNWMHGIGNPGERIWSETGQGWNGGSDNFVAGGGSDDERMTDIYDATPGFGPLRVNAQGFINATTQMLGEQP
jgi:hypothetical protein